MAKLVIKPETQGVYYTDTGTAVDCSGQNFIAHGNQGEVFSTNLDSLFNTPLVAKILYDSTLKDGVYAKKLLHYPDQRSVPYGLVVPLKLLYTKGSSSPKGFLMRSVTDHDLISRFRDPKFRAKFGLQQIFQTVINQSKLLDEIHRLGFVIGDLNDTGIMVNPDSQEVAQIDADSIQFGVYHCMVYTPEFADPTLNPRKLLYTSQNDYYAWTCVAFQTLFGIHPFGGHSDTPESQRRQKGVTVYDPNVKLPAHFKLWWRLVPDGLHDYFHETFSRGRRTSFPVDILANANISLCPKCGKEFASESECVCGAYIPRRAISSGVPSSIISTSSNQVAPASIPVTTDNNKLSLATDMDFHKLEDVVYSAGKLLYVHQTPDGEWLRETGAVVLADKKRKPVFRVLNPDTTIVAYPGGIVSDIEIMSNGVARKGLSTQMRESEPQIAVAENVFFTLGLSSTAMLNGFLELPGPLMVGQTKIFAGENTLVAISNENPPRNYLYVPNQKRKLLNIPPSKSAVLDYGAVFSEQGWYYYRVMVDFGCTFVRIWRIGLDGVVLDDTLVSEYIDHLFDQIVVWHDSVYLLFSDIVVKLNAMNLGGAQVVYDWPLPFGTGKFLPRGSQLRFWTQSTIHKVRF